MRVLHTFPEPQDPAPDRAGPEAACRLDSTAILRHARPGPRYTSYPPVTVWSTERGESVYLEALEALAQQPSGAIALYVHLPFCAERCAYCGCNATVTRRGTVVDRYLDRVETEAARVTEIVGRKLRVTQLHWGGGTPNFLDGEQTLRLHRILHHHFFVHPGGERGVEVDPRIADRTALHRYRDLGMNRVSLGVQDLDPRVQGAIGRIQPADLSRKVFGWAREAGFDSINVDLVYGLPYQTGATLDRTLDEVLSWGPDRLACFGYAHLPHLRANQRQVDARELPDEAGRLALFARAVRRLEEAGYLWVGLDHFARPDDPLARAAADGSLRRNFMGYAVNPPANLLALGVSAIGEVSGCYIQNDPHLGRYQKTLDAGRLPVARWHRLTPDDLVRRRAIHHLMCTLVLPHDLLPDSWRRQRDPWGGLRPFEAEGFVEIDGAQAKVTRPGRFLLRTLCRALDASEAGGAGFSPAT